MTELEGANMFMKTIKNIINKNAYFKNLIIRILYYRLNKEVSKNMKIFKDIDSIDHIERLTEAMNIHIKAKRKMYAIHGFGSESLHYGQIQNLYKYTGVKFNNNSIMPMLEHGITFDGEYSCKVFNQGFVGICQGDYMRAKLRDINKELPLIDIGPFIHYADNYYNEEKITKIRNKNGKTLLVFPNHSWEGTKESSYKYDEFIDSVFSIYSESFDTLYVCAYWLDIQSDMITEFKKRGAKIVSAGARFDEMFLSRLKTIISLSDAVISNDIGTNIGYCMYLEKPFYIINPVDEDPSLNWSNEFINYRDQFIEAFSIGNKRNTMVQEKLYKIFWGGDQSIRTKEEIHDIIVLHDYLVKECRGNINKIKNVIIKKDKILELMNNHEILHHALK